MAELIASSSIPPLKKAKNAGEFTFIWSIHNFSHFRNCELNQQSRLDSPQFNVQFLQKCFNLVLYPSRNDSTDFLNCYLEFSHESPCTVSYALSIRSSNGLFEELTEHTFIGSSKATGIERPGLLYVPDIGCRRYGYSNFLSYQELKGPDGYLDNDILTLRFRMRSITNTPVFIKCYAYTKIKVSKLDYVWILDDVVNSANALQYQFNQKATICSCCSCSLGGIRYLFISLLNGEKSDTIYFSITAGMDNKSSFLVYMIHLLDANGSVAHSAVGKHFFEILEHSKYEENTWNFPLVSKLWLLSQKKLYLPKGKLTLRCELSFSTNELDSDLEKYEFGKLNIQNLKIQSELIPDGHDLWKENMRQCYTEGKFSDLIVRTPERDIPVHRAVLSAQSTVFSAMLKHKMKESISGVVEIKDLESDTVSNMLTFLYTNTLDVVDRSEVQKLYFAADKYGIAALKRICSSYLTRCLDTSNVCDLLALADTHQDEELKSRARDFVMERAYEVVHSGAWKKLMENHSHVTSELMQKMISKNFLGFLKE